MSANQYELSDAPSDSISSLKFAPQTPSRLVVASWDKNVYLFDVLNGGQVLRKYEHRAPVLDICYGDTDDVAFSCGLDWDVRRINLTTGDQEVLSSHTAGVKSIVYSPQTKLLISGSWDSTLHVHPLSDPTHPPCTVTLPSKPFSLSLTPTKLVVAMANRIVYIYSLANLSDLCKIAHAKGGSDITINPTPIQQRESSMKFMTRCVACMPNDLGYATSSIEGRIAVDWFDESEEAQKKKYAFKCHRLLENDVDVVYPVNALMFHPKHQMSFASGGGDGHVSLWDGSAKRRIRQYQRFPSSVAALAFSCDGNYLAVGVSPGFEDGKEDPEGVVRIIIREGLNEEARGKGSK